MIFGVCVQEWLVSVAGTSVLPSRPSVDPGRIDALHFTVSLLVLFALLSLFCFSKSRWLYRCYFIAASSAWVLFVLCLMHITILPIEALDAWVARNQDKIRKTGWPMLDMRALRGQPEDYVLAAGRLGFIVALVLLLTLAAIMAIVASLLWNEPVDYAGEDDASCAVEATRGVVWRARG